MRSVTIALDEETARWIQIEAVKRGTSVSRLVGGMLKDQMKRAATFEQARRLYFNRSPTVLKEVESYPSRIQLHSK